MMKEYDENTNVFLELQKLFGPMSINDRLRIDVIMRIPVSSIPFFDTPHDRVDRLITHRYQKLSDRPQGYRQLVRAKWDKRCLERSIAKASGATSKTTRRL